MGDEDSPVDAHPPTLDYLTPAEPPPVADRAVERFTAGAGLVVLAMLGLSVRGGDDMPFCTAMGLLIELAMFAGIFALGRRACRWWRGGPMVERSRALTFIGGAAVVGMGVGAGALAEKLGLTARLYGGGAPVLLLFLLATAASPLWVYAKGPVV
jgi:hypothetical protein